MTGLYLWGGYALSDGVPVWGVAGYGKGGLSLIPSLDAPIRTDLVLTVGAVGLCAASLGELRREYGRERFGRAMLSVSILFNLQF